MDFNREAELDTSNVTDEVYGEGGGGYDSGGSGLGGRVAVGGGGVSILGLILYLVISQLGGGGGSLPSLPSGSGSYGGGGSVAQGGGSADDPRSLQNACHTGADVARNSRCEIVAISNSIEDYWADEFASSNERYSHAGLHVFSGATRTGCGAASADVGPFYCPADKNVYIDLSFYDELTQRFHAQGGPFARAYVLAHEYGHHVQDLLGRSTGGSATGATSGSVRLELQADCYAGVWANHAQQTKTPSGKPLIENITQNDINAAVDTASRIGDDYIQSKIAGRQVNESQFTHGSSEQREKWLQTGLKTGDPSKCNTFARGVSLG
ncbi:MAG TPA: neutral zinc metallopeptidase [Pseudonocardia sp.]|nr:neutral zinc metallopeptidase [Pseudonocardia sp.]